MIVQAHCARAGNFVITPREAGQAVCLLELSFFMQLPDIPLPSFGAPAIPYTEIYITSLTCLCCLILRACLCAGALHCSVKLRIHVFVSIVFVQSCIMILLDISSSNRLPPNDAQTDR